MLSFRPATTTDIELIQTLAREIWDECYPAIITQAQIDYMLGRMYAVDTIRAEMGGGIRYEIIVGEERPRGYLAWSVAGDGTGWLHKLYLGRQWRGRGAGQVALAQVIENVRAAGARTLRLYVNKRNRPALRAYERAGFQTVDSVVTEFGGGFVMDDYVMECRWT
jgi:GNAT superfamily N-acetyltransferase